MVCTFSGKPVDDSCEVEEDAPVCGSDSDGLVYKQRSDKVRCNVHGEWESVCDKAPVTEPICKAQPCTEIEEVVHANSETIKYSKTAVLSHYIEGTVGNLTECKEHYVPLTGNNAAICDEGEWTPQLECTLRDQTCSISDLKVAAQAITNLDAVGLSCPGGEMKDDENVYGGESCPFICRSPWYSTGALVCSDGNWGGSAKCALDAYWASWGSWGRCTKTCGGGIQTRSRDCNTAQNGGSSAICRTAQTTSRSCNTIKCPLNASWAPWGSWGDCTKTCGGGVQYRSRDCNTAQYGGSSSICTTAQTTSRSCNTIHCPLDASWASWGSWGRCSKTCDGGVQKRSRDCKIAQYGGSSAICTTAQTSSRSCNTNPCSVVILERKQVGDPE